MAIWVIKDGQREGPYDEDDVRELIYEGTYSENDPAIRDGQYDWSTIAQVMERQDGTLPAIAEAPPHPDELEEEPELDDSILEDELPPSATPPPLPSPQRPPPAMRVTVSDIDMPFGAMVIFLLKWVGAVLVVTLILSAIMGILWAILFALAAAILR
jgi:hypothetical protein